ncbi:hypothetical protein J2W97_004920 [Paenibacillus jamilae]|nr:hypothetical protein [Paenibacillus jamilae]
MPGRRPPVQRPGAALFLPEARAGSPAQKQFRLRRFPALAGHPGPEARRRQWWRP